jgi:hypothetical protein
MLFFINRGSIAYGVLIYEASSLCLAPGLPGSGVFFNESLRNPVAFVISLEFSTPGLISRQNDE